MDKITDSDSVDMGSIPIRNASQIREPPVFAGGSNYLTIVAFTRFDITFSNGSSVTYWPPEGECTMYGTPSRTPR